MRAFEVNPETRPCGCLISRPSAAASRVMVERCSEAKRLWAELRRVRDEMVEGESKRQGRKARIDAFASARESYQTHVFGAKPEAA